MKRTLILYASTHHGNTRRLAEAMAEAAGAELCDLLHDPLPDLSGYDLIGMASGIYYGKLHPRIPELLRQLEPRPGQRVFLAYTCGIRYRAYEKPVLELLRQKLDYILIDTPPAGVLSDAAALAKYADGAIYVVRQDMANSVQIVNSVQSLSGAVPLYGCVLNCTQAGTTRSGYRYGYRYGYQYGYSSHYSHYSHYSSDAGDQR